MKVIVTGGAGFIGSCIIRELNNRNITDIIVVDNVASTEKWKNLVNKKYTSYYNRNEFLDKLPDLKDVSYIIHMGACSATTELNFDYLYKNNFEYTKKLWEHCTSNKINFIYASSAATYGDGLFGFNDNDDINKLIPLNAYGYSKQLFDIWQAKQVNKPPQWVGFKFFNVYGPNEYYKGKMASVIMHGYKSIKENGKLNLFKSYREDYGDGEQTRDFIYVKDICNVINFMMNNQNVSGLFNLGTGKARTFYDLGKSVFDSLYLETNIDFVPMPENIRKKYQYFTEAKMNKLRSVGYSRKFYSLEDGIKDYVQNYLEKDFLTY
ncbi:MAG: ADP-glyceromanno-heptose 6-epimerase [Peptoanaerobacter stomatis]|uniref:ADP-glyceromanno-heptose 6-epimerase n=1 Tax=Peptoanaerobacter stomatis TaxID=796937 RepID=UPI003F9FAE16